MKDLSAFEQYENLKKWIKANHKKGLKNARHSTDCYVSQSNVTTFKHMGLYEIKSINAKSGEVVYNLLQDLDHAEFNVVFAKYYNKKIFYVFDKENKIVDKMHSIQDFSDRYNVHRFKAAKMLKNKSTFPSDYYISYDENYTIPAEHKGMKLNNSGRITKYRTEFIDKIKSGGEWSDLKLDDIASNCGVGNHAFNKWLKSHKELAEAYYSRDYLKNKRKRFLIHISDEDIEKIKPNNEWSNLSLVDLSIKLRISYRSLVRHAAENEYLKEVLNSRDFKTLKKEYKPRVSKKPKKEKVITVKKPILKPIKTIEVKKQTLKPKKEVKPKKDVINTVVKKELEKPKRVVKADKVGDYETESLLRRKALLVLEKAKKQNKPVKVLNKKSSLEELQQKLKVK